MPNLVKMLEVKGEDFLKGNSLQGNFPMGGLFQTASNFDPFDVIGHFMPGWGTTQIGSGTIKVAPKFLLPVVDNDNWIFALGNRDTSNNCFYRIKLSDNSVTDFSVDIAVNESAGVALTMNMLAYYNGLLVYNEQNSLRSFNYVTTGDTNILTSASISTAYPAPGWCVDEGNLYYCATSSGYVGMITNVAGTSGNVNNQFQLQNGMIPRDITKDGYYLVILADNNLTRTPASSGQSQVYFWDKHKSTADRIWPIDDDYVIGCRFVNQAVLIIGSKGIWRCTSATPPKLVWPFTSQAAALLPSSPSQIFTNKTLLYWVAPVVGLKVFAYGSLIGKPILFNPFTPAGGLDVHSSIAVAGGKIYTGSSAPVVYTQSPARGSAALQNADIQLAQPYQFSHAKVVLTQKLAAGQAVSFQAHSNNSQNTVCQIITKNYSDADVNARQTLKFQGPPSAGNDNSFEDFSFLLNTTGVGVKRITIYGTPQDDAQVNL